jgi:hypothetical protein
MSGKRATNLTNLLHAFFCVWGIAIKYLFFKRKKKLPKNENAIFVLSKKTKEVVLRKS